LADHRRGGGPIDGITSHSANTVAYRVRRAEALLGHPVTERQLELHVALRLARLIER